MEKISGVYCIVNVREQFQNGCSTGWVCGIIDTETGKEFAGSDVTPELAKKRALEFYGRARREEAYQRSVVR